MTDQLILGFLAFLTVFLVIAAVGFYQDEARFRGHVAILGACGLGLLAAFYIFPRLGLDGGSVEIAKLKVEIAQLKTDVVRSTKERLATKSELDRAVVDKAALERTQSEQMAALQDELTAIRARVRDPETGVRLADREPPTARGNQAPATPYERVLADINHLKSIEARKLPRDQEPPKDRVEQTRDLMQLKDRMATEIKTPDYDVGVYPDKEMVKGRVGKYYVVDLKNAASGVRYYFEGGKYTISRALPEFRSSLNAFIKDVLGKLDGQVRYDLMVRGRADVKPWQGRFEPNHEYRQIRYMRAIGGDRYINEMADEQLTESALRNENLPNLRAAFLREIVAETYPVKPPIILQGAVSPKADDKDRNVEIMLFVDW